jgi:DNA-directed RNA polymerase subunit RPC12/RpoP
MKIKWPWAKRVEPLPLPDNVVCIEAYLPHEVTELVCLRCRHRWISVHRTNTNLREYRCPRCRRMGMVIHTGQTLMGD